MALKLRRPAEMITKESLQQRESTCHPQSLSAGAGSFKRLLGGMTVCDHRRPFCLKELKYDCALWARWIVESLDILALFQSRCPSPACNMHSSAYMVTLVLESEIVCEGTTPRRPYGRNMRWGNPTEPE